MLSFCSENTEKHKTCLMCCMCLKSLKSECQSGFAGRIHLLSGEVVTQLKTCVRWNIETLDMDAFYREVTPSKLAEKDIIPTSLFRHPYPEMDEVKMLQETYGNTMFDG